MVLKRSWARSVTYRYWWRSGVNGEGYREILGICEGAKEDKAGWSNFLKHLKERGLQGVRLIVSDACMGLAESAAEFFPEAAWRRCVVHWYRNVFSHVIEKLPGLRLTKAAELVETAVEETLA
jgi:putative transposase